MDEQQKVSALDAGRLDRRDFLKKAGLATGAAAVMWMTPSVVSVGSRPAYASGTPTTRVCYVVDVACIEYDSISGNTTIQFQVSWDGSADCNNLSFIAFEVPSGSSPVSPADNNTIGPWNVEHTNGVSGQPDFASIKFENDGAIGDDGAACRIFEVIMSGDQTGETIKIGYKAGSDLVVTSLGLPSDEIECTDPGAGCPSIEDDQTD